MLWQAYMAQHGYVSLTIDNRGSYNRGRDFENIVHRNLGVAEMADQVKALEWIKAQGFIDTTRVGVHGWSFGGFMTTSLLTTYPKLFQVGVAGGPVIDWKYYEVMYGERYMDTPEENPEGYAATSTLNKAKNLKGKLLLIHGDIDPVEVWQNSLNFVRECVKAGVQVDYFVYPQHEHNVRGTDRVHLMQKVSNYFDDYLK
jgi:dipeptidyl-peptidase-4